MAYFWHIYGHAYNNAGIGSPLTLAGTAARLITPVTLVSTAGGVTLAASNGEFNIVYGGIYRIAYTISVKDNTSTNNGMYAFFAYNNSNANLITGTESRVYCVTQNRAQCMTGMGVATLTAGWTIGVFIANTTTANHDILIENFAMTVTRFS